MKIMRLLLALAAMAISTILLSNVRAANISDELLNMPITLTSGDVVTLKQYQGKTPVYLKFWATWCIPCRQQMGHFEKITQQYQDDLVVIAINLGINDNLAAVQEIQTEFGLSMPISIDHSGDLAQAFRLLGTPYHLLFDKQMNLVHLGHQADSVLDNKIALIAENKPLERLLDDAITEDNTPLKISLNDNKPQALFFTSTWCDWYFKQSRPVLSQQCIAAQQPINKLSEQFSDAIWQGVISRLWTGQAELDKYVEKYQLKHPIAVDNTNTLFHQYQIKTLPTLIMIKNGKELFRTSDFSNYQSLRDALSALL